MALEKKYFYSLDSLRGFAGLLILLIHLHFLFFKTLWIGVPVFFTLSGFLMTRILISYRNEKNYFKAFYYKRGLRIFPIYYLVLLASFIYARLLHFDTSQVLIYFFYLQNFTIPDHHAPIFANWMMGHTWTLSVEEMFYIFWPLVVRYVKLNHLSTVCWVILVTVVTTKLTLSMLIPNSHTQDLLLFPVWGNLDALMAGALVGIRSLDQAKTYTSGIDKPLWLAFILLIAASLFNLFNGSAKMEVVSSVLLSISAVAFAPFCVLFYTADKEKNIILDNKFLRYAGKIGYGLYLYHWIVYRLLDSLTSHHKIPQLNPLVISITKMGLSFLVATCSWYIIEQPLLKLKNYVSYR